MFYGIFYILTISFRVMSCIRKSFELDNNNKLVFVNPVERVKTVLERDRVQESNRKVIDGLAREEFPLLNKKTPELKDLVYLNNATTTQKPECVLKAVYDYYTTNNFSVFRGTASSHDFLSTKMYEDAREKVAKFINASSPSEIIFTSGVTDSLNFVSGTWGPNILKKGDVLLLPLSEHNSNLLPWWNLCNRVGCKVEYVKLQKNGLIDLDHLEHLLKVTNPKMLCCGHASNVIGVIQDMKTICKLAHNYGCYVLADSAQTVGKIKVDVQNLDIDFLAASGHKMYAPTGIGFLYYKKHLLENVDPTKSGGGTVKDVSFGSCEYMEAPYKFEAGTPPVAQAIGLGAAIDFLNRIGMDNVVAHERELMKYAYERIKGLVNLYDFDPELERLAIITFNVDGVDPYDLSAMLATRNVLTRAGKQCAYLLHKVFYCTDTIRISLSMYNTSHDIDVFIEALEDCIYTLKEKKCSS